MFPQRKGLLSVYRKCTRIKLEMGSADRWIAYYPEGKNATFRNRRSRRRSFLPSPQNLVGCRRSQRVLSQVLGVIVAGAKKEWGPATLQSTKRRFSSQVPGKKSHLRQKWARPAPGMGTTCARKRHDLRHGARDRRQKSRIGARKPAAGGNRHSFLFPAPLHDLQYSNKMSIFES